MVRWHDLVDRLPLGVVASAPPNERIWYANRRAVTLLGRRRCDLLGTRLASYLSPDQWDGLVRLADASPEECRAVVIRLPDGSVRPAVATTLRLGTGTPADTAPAECRVEPPSVVCLLQDGVDSDRLRQQLQMILDHSPVSFALLDRVGRALLGGGGDIPAAVDGLAEAADSSVFDAFPDEQEGLDLFRRSLSGERIQRTTRAFGGYYDLRLTPVMDARGQVDRVVAVGSDVTARERARARQADVAHVAHQALDTGDPALLWRTATRTLARGLPAHVSVWEVGSGTQLAHADPGPGRGPPADGNRQMIAGLAGQIAAAGAGVVHPDQIVVPGWRTIAVEIGRSARPETVVLVQRPDTDGTLEFSRDEEQHVQAIADVLGSAAARLAAERELRHRSLHDDLSGLANRAALLDHLGRVLDRGRHDRHTGVVFADLDGFKAINDDYGHVTGDAVLRVVADRLRAAVRPHDLVARLGGDEFAVVCADVRGHQEVERVARRVVARLDQPISVAGTSLVVTASVGVAISGSDLDDPDRLLNASDTAMYAAKRAGGGRTAVHPG